MSKKIGRVLSDALSGGHRPAKTHRVTGTNARGESFDLVRDEHTALDFAAEIRAKGGTATVTPLPKGD